MSTRARLLPFAIAAVLSSASARAADLRVGYQIGISETAATSATDNEDVFIDPNNPMVIGPGVVRLEGLNFTTNLTGNLSFDLLTSVLDHALVLGGGFSQTVPTADGGNRDRISTLQLGANYLSRVQRETWGLALGAGYQFLSNGRLGDAATGGTTSNTGVVSQPGQQFSSFVISGEVHTLTLTSQQQLTQRTWDLVLLETYVLTQNGIYNLAPGAPGQQGQQGAPLGPLTPRITTNIGTFVRQTTHTITPQLTFRSRIGRRGVLSTNALVSYTRPNDRNPQICDLRPPMGDEMGPQFECLPRVEAIRLSRNSTAAVVVPPFPETINSLAAIEYAHLFGQNQSIGFGVNGTMGFRVPTETNVEQVDVPRGSLSADSLIIEATANYQDVLPWELVLGLEVGVAQPRLFQAPLGPLPAGFVFQEVVGDWTPTFNLSLSRFFNPINTTLNVSRTIAPGALGASAFANENASVTFSYAPEINGNTAQFSAGFNVNQTRGIGRDLFVVPGVDCDPNLQASEIPGANLLQVASDNRGLGANVAVTVPLFRWGVFTALLNGAYTFSWLDPDPDGRLRRRDGTCGRVPFVTHGGLITLTLTFGRGPLAEMGAGSEEGAELSAFSSDPATGSPLTSSRLIREGAPLLDPGAGRRPGEPVQERRDSRQAYEQSRRQQQIEEDAKHRSDVVHGSGTIQDDEEAAQEREQEDRKERERKRERKFSEWPMDSVELPQEGAEPQKEKPPQN